MAEEKFYTILTNIGKAKVANAALLNSNVTLTTLKVGDGNGAYYNPTEDQKELKNVVYTCNVGSITIDKNNPNWILVETIIPGSVGGFTIREVGLFDVDGDLIAIGKYPETYKPVVANGATKDLNVRTIFEVSNAASVNLSINPSVIIATKEDIENLQKQVTQNTTYLNEKANTVDTTPMYLGAFFESNDNIGNNLFITGDGNSVLKINNTNIFKGRDTSILCKNGTFYFFHTATSGTDNITVEISKNLVDFETKNIKVSNDGSVIWAPDVFVDSDEKIYLIYSKEIGTETYNSIDYKDMRQYIVEIIDLDTLHIGTPKVLVLERDSKITDNRIDGHIIKKDDTYYLFVKFNGMNGTDANGAIEIWTSTNLEAWTCVNEGINSWMGIEAPFIVEIDGTYYLYVDDFSPLNYISGETYITNGGGILYSTSIDLLNWDSNFKLLKNDISLRHGFIAKVTDEDCKRIIVNKAVNSINLTLEELKNDYNNKINNYKNNLDTLQAKIDQKGYYNNIQVNLSINSAYASYRGFVPLMHANNYKITLTKMSYMTLSETIEVTSTASIGDTYNNGFSVQNTNSSTAGACCLIWFRVEEK